jgi:hypothetical protein
MEGGQGSIRGSSSEGFKADILESVEVLLYDKELRRLLCSIEGGVYRDTLIPALKRLLRPITKDDVVDIISNMIQLGLFTVEVRILPPTTLPKMFFVRRRRTKRGVIETLEIPHGFEVVDILEDAVILRPHKVFLKPTQELRAVCSVLNV